MRTTIYIVDDDAAVRDSLASLLDVHGYAAKAFASAHDFIDAFDGSPGVLVLDLDMPRMGGLELLAMIRARCPRLPVVMMTARVRTPRELGRLPPGIELLEKPFPDHVLLAAIGRAPPGLPD